MKRFFGRKLPLSAAIGAAMTVGLFGFAGAAFAEPPVAMAPPLDNQTVTDDNTIDVFNWDEIPEGEKVPIKRAIFDQGGYQLFDTVGETIVVPFTNKNLYVMKFAVSPDGTLYFVNDNGTPTLYVPENGYLENATVPGAKWYPFPEQFRPVQPIYMGVAPSYTEFINTGWYSDTVLYGGYCGYNSFISGGIFRPTLGLTFIIGNRPYYGWNSYTNYIHYHPAPYYVRYHNPRIYAYRPYRPSHVFQGHAGFPRNGGWRDDRDNHGDWNRPGRPNRPGNWDRNDGWHNNGGGSGSIRPGFHGADPNHTSPGGNTSRPGGGRPANGPDGRPGGDPGRIPDRRWHSDDRNNRPNDRDDRPNRPNPNPPGNTVVNNPNGNGNGSYGSSRPSDWNGNWNNNRNNPNNAGNRPDRPNDRPRGGFQGNSGQFQGGNTTVVTGNTNGGFGSINNNPPANVYSPATNQGRPTFQGGGQGGGARFDRPSYNNNNGGASPTTSTGGRPAFLGGRDSNNNNGNNNFRGNNNTSPGNTSQNRQPFMGGGNNPANGGQQFNPAFNRNGNSGGATNRTFSPGRGSNRGGRGGR